MSVEPHRDPEPDELPDPTACAALYVNLVSALLVTLGPKKSRVLLKAMSEGFADEQALENVEPIHASPRFASSVVAKREARSLFRAATPLFLARLRSA